MAMPLVWAALAALVAFGAYVRLAPSDPAVWHVNPLMDLAIVNGRASRAIGAPDAITTTANSALAVVRVPGRPQGVLEHLDRIALATPRTTRLAGSPEEGLITWVTRSALWGFPDYSTAEAGLSDVATTDMVIFARSRFGRSDRGVNAARLRDWLSRL